MAGIITTEKLALMAGVAVNDNMQSVAVALNKYGVEAGLDQPHRLAHFLAQVMHESGRFRYDREVWGPTPAQKRYETRTDLGNTAAVDGDGKKNAGRGPIQVTGGANIAEYEQWCRDRGYTPPDFTANPDLINTDPWEGLSAIWYWTTRNLNDLADANNSETITKRINGGLNGYPDRIAMYVRAALVLLGRQPDDIRGFQAEAQARNYLPQDEAGKPPQVDGDAGPLTRSAMHLMLVAMSRPSVLGDIKAAPVVEERQVPVAVAPQGGEKRAVNWWSGLIGIGAAPFAAFGQLDTVGKLLVVGVSVVAIGVLLWRGDTIARRIKTIIGQIEGVA